MKVNSSSILLAVQGIGKPSSWARFDLINGNRSDWYNSGSTDGIVFVPQQDIKLAGFSTWAAKEDSTYEIKYTISINGTEVLKREPHQAPPFGGEKNTCCRNMLEECIDVKAGQKIKFVSVVAKNIANNENVLTWSGQNGHDYANVKNKDMGLFKVEDSDDSNNGTSTGSGHYPEIFYHLD